MAGWKVKIIQLHLYLFYRDLYTTYFLSLTSYMCIAWLKNSSMFLRTNTFLIIPDSYACIWLQNVLTYIALQVVNSETKSVP